MKMSKFSAIDEVWSLVKETQKNLKEFSVGQKELQSSQKETDRSIKELSVSQKETDRSIKELSVSQKETDRSIKELSVGQKELQSSQKETSKQLKKTDAMFNTRWGKLVESLVAGDLINLLKQKGIQVTHTFKNLKREFEDQKFEFDIVAVNGDEAVVVEVKTVLGVKDIDYFMEKLKRFVLFAPEYKGKKIYGAVAYIKVDQSSDVNAEKKVYLLFVLQGTVPVLPTEKILSQKLLARLLEKFSTFEKS